MRNTLSNRLQQARERLFVGRAAQLESFALALKSDSWPVAVWHLHGLGGMGKTSLLRQWKAQAREAGLAVITLDGRDFEPNQAAFCHALREALREVVRESLREIPDNALQMAPETPGTPQALRESLCESLCEALERVPTRVVLQIDTYELLKPLDGFLRESFLPHLPENTTVMLAGREELSFEWHSDAAWRELVRDFNLDTLSASEERLYLEKRGIEPPFQAHILEWAHGHPLALSLAADIWLQHPDAHHLSSENGAKEALQDAAPDFRPGDLPHLVGPLLGHLAREVPSPAHRAALEASAIVLSMTQELLRDMLGDLVGHSPAHLPAPAHSPAQAHSQGSNAANEALEEATKAVGAKADSDEAAPPDIRALFEWLRALSIMQSDRFGVFPHDLARELLVADLRWRSPDWHAELHRRAREHYLRRIHRAAGAEQQRVIFNCIYLHRLSPVVGPYLRWSDSSCSLDSARPGDVPVLLDMVEKHEGKTSRAIAAQHFEAQPAGIVVVRDANGLAQGFVFQLALQGISDALCEADPAARAARDFLKLNAPLRTGANGDNRANDQATMFRFWMDRELYQGVGATQSLIFVQAVRHYMTTPHLAFTLFACAEPDFWSDGFLYADLGRVRGADFEVEGHKFGVFGHDWRARPVLSWLDLLSQRELQSVAPASKAAPVLVQGTDFVVLDEAEFQRAVQLALRSGDAAALKRNPLLHTELVHRRALQISQERNASGHAALEPDVSRQNALQGLPSLDERVVALRDLLREAIAKVGAAPRQEKAHRALELVFGRRALSQESAAAAMDVSHSSLRRYLRAGVAQVAAALHEQENRRDAQRDVQDAAFKISSKTPDERNSNLF